MLSPESRRHIATLPLKERRAALKGYVCEICGVKPARNVLLNSLLLCCTNRADRCPNDIPLEGSICWGCGAPAQGKTKSGWVCSPGTATGCHVITKHQHEAKARTQALAQQDPVLKERRRSRYVNTLQERYGVSGVMAIPDALAKYKATCHERYGVDNAAQAEEIKARVRAANRTIYGVNYPSQLPERRNNLKNKCIELFGVPSCVSSPEWREAYKARTGEDHPMKHEVHKATQRRVFLRRYGVPSSFGHPLVQAKCQQTLMSRYGVSNPAQSPALLARRDVHNLEKYGVANPGGLPESLDKQAATNFTCYGVRYAIQNSEVFRTAYLPRFYKSKEFILPSGRVIHYQGYELGAIRDALAAWGEVDILFNGDLNFSYLDPATARPRTYYPDLAVLSTRKVIEVKSVYTLQHGLKSDLVPKLLAALENGWEPVVELRGPELDLIETYSFDNILDLQAELGRAL